MLEVTVCEIFEGLSQFSAFWSMREIVIGWLWVLKLVKHVEGGLRGVDGSIWAEEAREVLYSYAVLRARV